MRVPACRVEAVAGVSRVPPYFPGIPFITDALWAYVFRTHLLRATKRRHFLFSSPARRQYQGRGALSQTCGKYRLVVVVPVPKSPELSAGKISDCSDS